jgi:hypothetical protein
MLQARRGEKDMMQKTRFMVVQEAIQVLVRHLGCLPPSDRTLDLRARVEECRREAEEWPALPPSDREQNGLMKRVLALHIDVTKLERYALAAQSSASLGMQDSPG